MNETTMTSDPNDSDIEFEEEEIEDELVVEYDIASYPSDLTLSVIHEMWQNEDIIIPDFQRNFVWTIRQASLLIDSFLSGLPIPQLFFYIDRDNKSLVVDGQQRILSVIFFLEGYFGDENLQGRRQVFRLSGLDPRSPYHNKRYSDLSDSDKRKLRSAVLRVVNIRQISPRHDSTSVYHIFERLNTGGTPLRPQEIRNCVFRGQFADALKELNKDECWRSLLGKKKFDKHQRDIELILRVFSLVNNWKNYEKPMKQFLNVNMQKNQSGKNDRVQTFLETFPRAARYIAENLRIKPFHIRGPLNSSALDSILSIVIENIDKLPEDIDQRYKNLLADPDFHDATYYGTSDSVVLHKRFALVHKCLID